ncbi:putative oxidoreductase [Hypoxylon sp. FL1284]|nr:putative oxidoreductase [Hypoxylon sp. FL1284]
MSSPARVSQRQTAGILTAEKVFLLGSAGYNSSQSSHFSPQAAPTHPFPLTSSGNNRFYDLSVRAGGHTWFTTVNSALSVIIIDIRDLNSIDLSDDKSTVSVGTGATWDAVYRKLEPDGLSVARGRVVSVGVGDLILGGETSYFSPHEGLALTFNLLSEINQQARIYGETMAAENYDPILDLPDIGIPSATAAIANVSTIMPNLNVKGVMWGVNVEPLPSQMYRRGGADANALDLSDHHGSLNLGLVSPWYGAPRAFMANVERRAKHHGVYGPYVEVIKEYGEKNIKKLQEMVKSGFKIVDDDREAR